MKQVEYFNWHITDPITGKRHLSRWKMQREVAIARDPTAELNLATREVRELPETEEERWQALYRGRVGVAG